MTADRRFVAGFSRPVQADKSEGPRILGRTTIRAKPPNSNFGLSARRSTDHFEAFDYFGRLAVVMKCSAIVLFFLWISDAVPADQSNCSNCTDGAPKLNKTAYENLKLEMEKAKILRKLGLKTPPNVSLKALSSSKRFFVERSIDSMQTFKAPEYLAEDVDETRRILIAGSDISGSEKCSMEQDCFGFDFPPEFYSQGPIAFGLANVTLWVQIGAADSSATIEIIEPHPNSEQTLIGTSNAEGWVDLNFTEFVKGWQTRRHQRNKTKVLQIKCLDCDGNELSADEDRQPFFEIWTEHLEKSRKRRSGSPSACSANIYSHCCLQRYWVNFTTIGWNDWVIRPNGYWANYCTGNCRYGSTEVHGVTMQQSAGAHEANGEPYDPDMIPCCSAKGERGEIQMIYMLNVSDVRQKVLKNMVVQSCGC